MLFTFTVRRLARSARLVLACVAIGAVGASTVPAAAFATGEYEPNDSLSTAFGPLAGGLDYAATFETENDGDWYRFYVRNYSQVELSAVTLDYRCQSSNNVMTIRLRDGDGKNLRFFYLPSSVRREGEVARLRLTLDAGRYFITATHDGFCEQTVYRIRVDPGMAITPSQACGEGILLRNNTLPQAARINRELVANTKAIKRAKRVLRRAIRRGRSGRSLKRRTASQLRRLTRQRRRLRSLRDQHQTTLNGASQQIRTSC